MRRYFGPNPEERFWRYVEIIPFHNCWEWIGPTNGVYGTLHIARKHYYAHRFSYELLNGKIDYPNRALHLDHSCKNKLCVNPRHLSLVSARQNVLKDNNGALAVKASQTKCIHGHELVYFEKYGRRQCPTCRRAADVRRYERERVK